MTRKIEAIFLDTGNTLRVVSKDVLFQNRAQQELVNLLGVTETPAVFCKHLGERYEKFKAYAKETLIQPSEVELWTRWMLPDSPAEKIATLSSRLTHIWIDQSERRVLRPDAKQTVIELNKRGYVL